jgi:hypothetical protein
MRFRSCLRSAPPGLRFGRIDAHFGPTRRQALCEPPASSSARWRGSSQWFIAISGFARISKLFKEPIVGKGRARDATNHPLLQTSVDLQPKTIAKMSSDIANQAKSALGWSLTRDRCFQLRMAGAQKHGRGWDSREALTPRECPLLKNGQCLARIELKSVRLVQVFPAHTPARNRSPVLSPWP